MIRTSEEQYLHDIIESHISPLRNEAKELRAKLNEINSVNNKETLMSFEDSYRYHIMCARATLYPDKTFEEVMIIIEDNLCKLKP